MKVKFLVLCFMAVLLSACVYAQTDKIIEKSIDSVITVKTDTGLGSGFFVNQDGYVLTNYHVVYGANEINFQIGSNFFAAKIIDCDQNLDVALLKSDQLSGVPPLVLADSDKISVSEDCYAIGSPIGLDSTVTKGIVSNKQRMINNINYIQTDAVINHGNSGGPLLNSDGEVLGINTFIDSETGNYGFALPINTVIPMLERSSVSCIRNIDNFRNYQQQPQTQQPGVNVPESNADKSAENKSEKGAETDTDSENSNDNAKKSQLLYIIGSAVLVLLIAAAIAIFIVKRKKKTAVPQTSSASVPHNAPADDNYDDINIALSDFKPSPDKKPADNYDDIDIELH